MRPRRACKLIATLVAAALPAPSLSADGPYLPTLVATVEAAAPAALRRHRAPGAAVAMVLDGTRVWSGGFGLADLQTLAPVTAETVFEAASVAKPVN